jgi:hypothetical protein
VPVDLAGLTVSELLRLHGETLAELRRRDVIRTANAPAGDLAELLVARATGGTLADNSKRSWDVCVGDCDADGIRLQVKARLVDDMTTRSKRQLSPFRAWEFDSAVLVLFDPNYAVRRAACLPMEDVKAASRRQAHVNGHIVFATDRVLSQGEDWTAKLQAVVL